MKVLMILCWNWRQIYLFMVYVPEGIPVYACFISNGVFLWVLFGEGVYTCHRHFWRCVADSTIRLMCTLIPCPPFFFCVTITHNISPTGTLCVCVFGKFMSINTVCVYKKRKGETSWKLGYKCWTSLTYNFFSAWFITVGSHCRWRSVLAR